MGSFNLLSEILFVQAKIIATGGVPVVRFQSLERDSVCSSAVAFRAEWPDAPFQSLERDSVCSSLQCGHVLETEEHCFNLLSEILFVQATRFTKVTSRSATFQSLERDSVCSSYCAAWPPYPAVPRFNLLSEILFVQARMNAARQVCQRGVSIS